MECYSKHREIETTYAAVIAMLVQLCGDGLVVSSDLELESHNSANQNFLGQYWKTIMDYVSPKLKSVIRSIYTGATSKQQIIQSLVNAPATTTSEYFGKLLFGAELYSVVLSSNPPLSNFQDAINMMQIALIEWAPQSYSKLLSGSILRDLDSSGYWRVISCFGASSVHILTLGSTDSGEKLLHLEKALINLLGAQTLPEPVPGILLKSSKGSRPGHFLCRQIAVDIWTFLLVTPSNDLTKRQIQILSHLV